MRQPNSTCKYSRRCASLCRPRAAMSAEGSNGLRAAWMGFCSLWRPRASSQFRTGEGTCKGAPCFLTGGPLCVVQGPGPHTCPTTPRCLVSGPPLSLLPRWGPTSLPQYGMFIMWCDSTDGGKSLPGPLRTKCELCGRITGAPGPGRSWGPAGPRPAPALPKRLPEAGRPDHPVSSLFCNKMWFHIPVLSQETSANSTGGGGFWKRLC